MLREETEYFRNEVCEKFVGSIIEEIRRRVGIERELASSVEIV